MSPRWVEALRAWWPAPLRPLPPGEHERVLAAARVERHGGLTALYLAGTPYEMGYQHGVLARDLIHGFRSAAYDYVASLVPVPAWLARPLLFQQAAAYWPTIPPEYALEMQGIAHGAGVHPIEVLVSTAIWEMYLVSGCSEFAAAGPGTAGGSLLHGYNYDLMHPDHALIQPYLAAIFYRPNQGVPFFTVNTVGSIGANAGMNEAGVSVAWDNTYLRDDKLTREIQGPVVPFILTLRKLLQHSRSLEEAVEVVTGSLPRPLGDIVIIGSASEGQAAALETAGKIHAARQTEGGAVWSTNCFRSPELAPHDRRGDGRALSGDAEWQQFPRYTAYRQLFAGCQGQLDPPTAAAFLRDPYPREAGGFVHPNPAARATICREFTSWSLVMEPASGCLWVSDTKVPAPQGRFFAFDLSAWERLPENDLAPTGYQAALLCGRRFLSGDRSGARTALQEAASLDGPSAPLSLMRAILQGLAEEQEEAAETLQQVTTRWAGTPAEDLARAWLDGKAVPGLEPLSSKAIPFPSAIRPLIHFRPAAGWAERATPAPDRGH
jgi:hypothetical protein